MRQSLFFVVLMAFSGLAVHAQTPAVAPLPNVDFLSNRPSDAPSSTLGHDYRIGINDLLEVTVFEAPDLSVITRVAASGAISLKFLGNIKAAGETQQELEHSIESAAKSVIKDPHVQVFIREYASQPVSVLGAVKLPGIYQMKGQKTLIEMIAQAQGIDMAISGKTIQVLRKEAGPDNSPVTITIDAEDLLQNGKSELNIPIEAGDIINVPRAGSIFIYGEVVRPDELSLKGGRNLTVAQAIARGGGFTKEAKKQDCRIIRPHADGTKEEIPVDMKKIVMGTADDVTMMANDVLVVPPNKVRTGFNRALDTVISVAVGRAIYGGF